ncbi:FeoB-associated Cys-rich membrane protein [Peptoniphilaceae bacterium SGI.131]
MLDYIIYLFVGLAAFSAIYKIYRDKKENPGKCSGCGFYKECSSNSCSGHEFSKKANTKM